MTARLDHLRRTVDQLEEPYRARALEAHRILEEARISNGRPWQAALEQIKLAALDWERSRPPLVPCGIGRCAIRYRHPEALLRHRALVHGT
jgi:hypothetical protein